MICGVNIGGKDTLEEWGLMLCNDLSIGAAVPRYRFIEIPEMSGALDLTEALTGSVPYDQRTITFTLFAVHDVIAGTRSPATEEHFQTVLARFSGFANGKRLHLYLPDNPDHYFVGRVSVGGKSGYNSGRVKVEVLADPYRLKDGETTLTVDDEDFFKTATPGALVTFDDGGENLPMTSVEVSLSPIQSLNGYDSPWPAGGGKNKFPKNATDSSFTKNGITFTANNGVYTIEGTAETGTSTYFTLSDTIDISPSTKKICFLNTGGSSGVACRMMRSGSIIHYWTLSYANYVATRWTDTGNENINQIGFNVTAGTTVNITISPVLLELSEANATNFIPWENICPISGHSGAELKIGSTYPTAVNTYSVTFSDQGTVYGGTYDFVSGKLRVIWRCDTYDGTENWNIFSNISGTFMKTISGASFTVPGYTSLPISGEVMCSHLKNQTRKVIAEKTDSGIGIVDAKIVCLHVNSSISTVAELQTYIAAQNAAGTPFQIGYKLATPLEYDLTPQEVTSLLGKNNVWSNDGDISELVYMFTNEIIIDNEGMPAIPTINASEAGPTVTLRGASHVLAAGDNRFSDLILQSGENVMQVEDPAGTLTIKYQEGML